MKKLNLFCAILAAFLAPLFFIEAYGQKSIFLLILGLLCAIGGAFAIVEHYKTK